jgi:tRNA nucleotidyltransferase (CCA-adding enzyme)
MKSYVVGGAVRDRLLGLPVHDRDHVVVGSSPQEMLDAGFLPVGRDFPVFLHPTTKEEYALARTERKTAPGYAGFTFHADASVTLEEDLARRDLTINAMAEDDQGRVIDPFGGQRDLASRVLRHVGEAFVEDPVRILRVARFAARFADFHVAPETMLLMRRMVADGEVDALVAERVWQECARGLGEAHPQRMLEVLLGCGALARIAPPLAVHGIPWLALAAAARVDAPLEVRFAVWMGESQLAFDELGRVCQALRVPGPCRELSVLTLRECPTLASTTRSPEALLSWIERSDGLRREERFEQALLTCALLAGRDSASDQVSASLRRGLARVRAVDAGAIAAISERAEIATAIRRARLAALSES